jgi:hypothetical protein
MIVPGIFVGAILLIGGSFLPSMFAQYKIPAQLIGVALVLFFTFQSGRYSISSEYQLQNAADTALIENLKAQSVNNNVAIVTEYKEKIKYVDIWRDLPVRVYVTEVADAKCIIDNSTSDNIRMLFTNSSKGLNASTPTGTHGITK